MYKISVPIKSAPLPLILISVFALLMPFELLWAECEQSYPNADVTRQLSKTEYQNCSLDKMVQNYAKLLQDKKRLLTALRPAYERKLDKEVASENLNKTERIVRLGDYDTKLSALSTKKDSLESWVSAIYTDTGTDEVKDVPQEKKITLRALLKKSKDDSRALKRKISWAKDEITAEEKDEFCKLDFYFRVSEGLIPKIRQCLKAQN